ncbi:uncharacterized protein LOC133971341 [Platichthys flesus]|uniref:uncharacterized protein LOC133971341 n=1 Tax=Platichthys flesus TaxID=8260 RepID=UPI002DB5E871|nr:uncharacterized protein LOC133971341 [Platichthys flesus]
MFPICFQVHKLKMAGLHPMLLFGREKKGSVSCDSISGLELVSDTDYKSLKIIEGLYGSLVTVIVKRERANPLTPVDPEGPRELAESPLHPEATGEDREEGEEGEEEETFDLLLTPCDPAPTAPATAPSTSHSHPRPSSPPSSSPLSNSKESCPPKHPGKTLQINHLRKVCFPNKFHLIFGLSPQFKQGSYYHVFPAVESC